MVSIPQLALRSWEFLFTLITMALIGNVIADAYAGNPSSINYAIFVTIIDMLVVLAGFAISFMDISAAGIIIAVGDILAALFTFIAGVVLAAKLRVHSCNNAAYTSTNSLTNGSHNMEKRCRELQASTAFFWFLLPAFCISAFLSLKNSGGASMRRGGMRKGGPSMSQV